MNLIIKQSGEKDFYPTENLTREAFWNIYKPGCDEHLVLHNIRKSSSYIPELDLVAFFKNEIVGHIISTKARVIDSLDVEHEVLCAGPLSVLPSLKKQGIGAKLMEASISEAERMRYAAMILFGAPDYYHRFGFRNAAEYGITTKDYQNFDAFMALELQPDALAEVQGRFLEDNAYVIDSKELEEFEKQFPYKEKLRTDTQLF